MSWLDIGLLLVQALHPPPLTKIGYESEFRIEQTPLPSTEITEYIDSYLHTLLSILVTVLACLLPISSILILYFISNTGARLGVAVAFTAVFALCLALVTKGKRVEIFAATSA
jgi:hypothetical protein